MKNSNTWEGLNFILGVVLVAMLLCCCMFYFTNSTVEHTTVTDQWWTSKVTQVQYQYVQECLRYSCSYTYKWIPINEMLRHGYVSDPVQYPANDFSSTCGSIPTTNCTQLLYEVHYYLVTPLVECVYDDDGRWINLKIGDEVSIVHTSFTNYYDCNTLKVAGTQ